MHEIAIDPEAARGTITFYELPAASLMSVPGARVELLENLVSRNVDGFRLEEDAWQDAA